MINTDQTLEQMKQLRLHGMYNAYRSQLELPMNQQLDGHDLIAYLTQSEQENRTNEKTTYYLKLAKFRLPATIEQIDCNPGRNLTKNQLATLANGNYLDHGENILITGATGCGQKYSKPFFDKIRCWLDEHIDKHVPDSLLAKAINYANNQWDKLNILFLNGRIDVDNNTTENAIRPITLFRKNSLFASNEHGGERAALFYSLVESCKLNSIDPFEYLHDVYDRLHDCTAAELVQLLPSNWKPTKVKNTKR